MAELTISEVARKIGLQPSAIRYYEQIGVLPHPPRISGQRRYDPTVLYRLAIVQRARQLGFTLEEIRKLFFGFRQGTRASERWQNLSRRKLARARRFARQHKDSPRHAQEDDATLPLRYLGPMRQGNISKPLREGYDEICLPSFATVSGSRATLK